MAEVNTVLDAMIACGIDNEVLFMEETQAQRIADDIFDNLFTSCMDITFKELDKHFKAYSLHPKFKYPKPFLLRKILAFFQNVMSF
jgi:hypothetical protein